MFISGGENVYPAEIENVLRSHPKILDAAVVGVPDDKWGEVGSAAVVIRTGENIDSSELTKWCQQRMGKYKIPKAITFVAFLPRTETGKVSKQEIREQLLNGPPCVR
jgi:acyl-CoA synthetase (AMP-forming)/AMP-acid ligase II